tara:strand:+ start:5007 stop:5606 length:600 start_codon:yes stop_codon:yes gene_type:complete
MLPRKKGFHRHHIIPRHAGGTDDDENLVYLTKEEHAKAHWDLYEKYGKDQDRRAAILVENGGDLNSPELIEWRKESNTKAAYAAHEAKLENGFYDKLGKLNSERLKGISNPEHSERLKEKFKTHKMLWWNNGIEQIRSPECPAEGWRRGRINTGTMSSTLKEKYAAAPNFWWNNGIKNTRKTECPGPEWVRGKLSKLKL